MIDNSLHLKYTLKCMIKLAVVYTSVWMKRSKTCFLDVRMVVIERQTV